MIILMNRCREKSFVDPAPSRNGRNRNGGRSAVRSFESPALVEQGDDGDEDHGNGCRDDRDLGGGIVFFRGIVGRGLARDVSGELIVFRRHGDEIGCSGPDELDNICIFTSRDGECESGLLLAVDEYSHGSMGSVFYGV